MQFMDIAFFVLNVPENDRIGRTGILACGTDFIGTKLAIAFGLGLDLGTLNSLHAVGALFHDTPTADGDLWIHHHAL